MDYPDGHEDPRITERDRAWARIMEQRKCPSHARVLRCLMLPAAMTIKAVVSTLAFLIGAPHDRQRR